jgi:hypothetical protein
MDFGQTPEQLEQCRRALVMSAPNSAAPATCGEMLQLVERLSRAETELRQLQGD